MNLAPVGAVVALLALTSLGASPSVPATTRSSALERPAARDASGHGADGARYAAPVLGAADVVRPFDAPDTPWSAGHRGVDLAADVGVDVLAPASGTVTFAGTVVDRGVVTVLHDDGLRSSVEPVDPVVAAGDHVEGGAPIGVLQTGHCVERSCVHWGVRRGDTYLDPLALLRAAGPVVLLPVPHRATGR